jgi:hypothetical protein
MLWHADETRWLVFATREGKVGYRCRALKVELCSVLPTPQ